MTRRQFQTTDSTYRIERHPAGWMVVEQWWEIDRRGEKADEFENHGPFPTRAGAEAEKTRLEAL